MSLTAAAPDPNADSVVLRPNPGRFTLFPIVHEDLFELYKTAKASTWFPAEVDLAHDLHDWEHKLTEDERWFIKHVLAFFAASDGIVMENLQLNFASEVQLAEARSFYAHQTFIESVHSETYSLLIETYVKDTTEKDQLFRAVETIATVTQKAAWVLAYMDRTQVDFATRLFSFAITEGLFFSASFCAIFWLKKRNLLPGLNFSNQLIARDEGLHVRFAALLYSKLDVRVPVTTARRIMREAVAIEHDFVCAAIPVRLIGMNQTQMCAYVEFVADHLLGLLGYDEPLYHTDNPFEWMDVISMQCKTNFFEHRVSEYQKSGVKAHAEEMEIKFDVDF